MGNMMDGKSVSSERNGLVTQPGELQVTNTGCGLFLVGASFTQGTISSIPIGGSISPEGFLPSIMLLVMIMVTVVIIAVILVVVVVANVGVVIVVTIIGVVVVVTIIGVVVVIGVFAIIKLSTRTILIGQEPFQFSLGDLVGLLYSNRFGIGIPPGRGILGESTSRKFHFAVLGTIATRKYRFSSFKPTNETNSSFRTIEVERLAAHKLLSGGGVVDLTSDEDPIDEDRDTEVGDSKVLVSLGKISSGGRKSQELNSDNIIGITVGEAIGACSGGIERIKTQVGDQCACKILGYLLDNFMEVLEENSTNEVKKDDLNQKFLTSLAPEWLMHTIVWRNRNDLDTMSLDDLYNHIKVYEAKVQTKSNSNSQNMAFISSSKNSSGNEDGNTACVSTSSTTFPTASANVATISQDTASAYIASQSNGSQIKFEDINQIDADDMEEMDIKWNMALLSMRADKAHRSQESGRKESYRQGSKDEEKTPKELMAIDGVGWDWSYMANKGEDHALVADAEAPTEFALMANTESKVFDNSLCSNDCKKNNDSLNSKIKDLTGELFEANNYIYHYKLAVAQLKGRLVEYKEREVKYIEKTRTLEMYRASNLKCIKTLDKELEELKLEKDGLDGKLAGLLKASKNLDNLIKSQRPSPTVASTSAEGQNKDSSTFEDVASPNTPKPFVKFVKPKDNQSESKTDKQETPKKPQVKYAEQYKHSNKKTTVKGNQRNWNNLKSYQLGPEFVLKKKACYNCGDFSHLANDCRKRVQRETSRSQNHAYMDPSHRSAGYRPHGAPMRSPHRSVGHRPHGASLRPLNRPTGHRPHGPSMNPIRPNMNSARPNRSFSIQAPSYETSPFLKSSAVKTQYRAPWVPTVNKNNPPDNKKISTGRRNFPTVNRKFSTASRKFTTGSTKIHIADIGKKGKAVNSLACWTWNPLQKLSNKGPINNSVSMMFKKYTYIDTQGRLKSDSGCSRHMTGNISYLSDFEPFDGGYVSFGQGGCKISGKGTIKTENLELENVYFVKDLKYNLFSVSQICDNKNSVLYTDAECIVLGRNFKLLDDANILLRKPR
uniref:Ribonuclease H-like domain-containing protein n=1 Tax=Tanacetum cinerariifolium TaxID=118510 RepID=A0A6L2LNW5_TANCI|nr:ribonuclease H-like domain-containing protein [Tanacetum cinerariifolium]